MSRRLSFLASIALPALAFAAPSPQVPIAGSAIPQFAQPLPLLSVQTAGAPNNVIDTRVVTGPLKIRMCEFRTHVLPPNTFVVGQQPETWTWGYIVGDTCPTGVQETYLGPVLVNTRGNPTEINFVNALGDTTNTNVLAYKYSTDQTLHWADPLALQQDQPMPLNSGFANYCNMVGGIPGFGTSCSLNYSGPIAAVPHLHGGEVPPEIDGGPDAWFTSDGAHKGHGYYTKLFFSGDGTPVASNAAIYRYPNGQQAAPLWFHDHTLGATRLNVYAGLAGGYYLVDPAQALPAGFPGVADVIPLILQDRMFDTNGQLYFPGDTSGGLLTSPNPQHPYWVPEFVGDTVVVNGKAWPFLEVQPKRYRFLVLNGSNARTYELFLNQPSNKKHAPVIYVIGNDGGYLDTPGVIDPALGQKLVIMPGERYEIIVDFGGIPAGSTLLLKNTGKTPYPAGTSPQGTTLGQLLQFRVTCPATGCPTDTSWNPATLGTIRLNQPITRLSVPATGTLAPGVTVDATRQLTLNEVALPPQTAVDPVTNTLTAYPGGPVEILVNNTKWSGDSPRTFGDFRQVTINGVTTGFSETPLEGTTEVWEIVNLTADAHPIHTHLASFQVLNRQAFNQTNYNAAYAAAFPCTPVPPATTCVGAYLPGFGPPLHYQTGNPRALGGNPDVTAFLQGPLRLPSAQEVGWKDTVLVLPGFVTRFVVRWAPNDTALTAASAQRSYPFSPAGVDPATGQVGHGYVWHCHIIDHEDNEMMRPDLIDPNPLAVRSYLRSRDY